MNKKICSILKFQKKFNKKECEECFDRKYCLTKDKNEREDE